MAQSLIRIFDVFEQAQQAREALLAEGFGPEQIELRIANDEAGPTEGNFYVGNSSDRSPDHTYDRNYAHIEQAGQCILTVGPDDASAAERAGCRGSAGVIPKCLNVQLTSLLASGVCFE